MECTQLDETAYRVANPEIADMVNITLIATSASAFFTQDMEGADSLRGEMNTGPHSNGTRAAQRGHAIDHEIADNRVLL